MLLQRARIFLVLQRKRRNIIWTYADFCEIHWNRLL